MRFRALGLPICTCLLSAALSGADSFSYASAKVGSAPSSALPGIFSSSFTEPAALLLLGVSLTGAVALGRMWHGKSNRKALVGEDFPPKVQATRTSAASV
jgi:hypothetical protein